MGSGSRALARRVFCINAALREYYRQNTGHFLYGLEDLDETERADAEVMATTRRTDNPRSTSWS